VGVFCQARAKEDKNNPFAPVRLNSNLINQILKYLLTIYPTSKAKLIEAIDPPAPLARVRAVEILEEKLTEE